MRRAILLAVAAVASFAVLGGWQPATDRSPTEVAQPTTVDTIRRSPVDLVLPLDLYRLDAVESHLAGEALGQLEVACMRGLGFHDFARPALPAAPLVEASNRRYGVINEGVAREFGYHLPYSALSDSRMAAFDRWRESLTAREASALYGPAGDAGCARDASTTLRRGVNADDLAWFTELDFDSYETSRADPRVSSAMSAWSECMRRNGLAYESHDEAMSDPQWTLDSAAATRDEITTAAADARCKHTSGLLKTWISVETSLQTGLISRDPGRFEALARAKKLYLANVISLLR